MTQRIGHGPGLVAGSVSHPATSCVPVVCRVTVGDGKRERSPRLPGPGSTTRQKGEPMPDTTTLQHAPAVADLDDVLAWIAESENHLAHTRPCCICGLSGVGYAYQVRGMYDADGVPMRAHEECAR